MSDYTVTRYEFNIAAGIAHDFWVLERINSDGTTERLAVLHGMATDANGNPPAPVTVPRVMGFCFDPSPDRRLFATGGRAWIPYHWQPHRAGRYP